MLLGIFHIKRDTTKSGTTALFSYLKTHPEVFMSTIKEPHFFASDIRGRRRRVTTCEEYLNCFAGVRDEQRIGEASTSYLRSRTAPYELRATAPDARIIIMVRNPVDIMYASYSENVFDAFEDSADFETALETDQVRELRTLPGQGEQHEPIGVFGYREQARLAPQVERYLELFGRDNVYVIVFDDFTTDTLRLYRDVLCFLDVDDTIYPRQLPVVHGNRRVRNRAFQKLVMRPPQALRTLLPAFLRRLLRRYASRVNVVFEPRPPMRPDFRRRLQRDVAAEVEELGNLLDRDLSAWCKS
jgi:Sulfotransferase domain